MKPTISNIEIHDFFTSSKIARRTRAFEEMTFLSLVEILPAGTFSRR